MSPPGRKGNPTFSQQKGGRVYHCEKERATKAVGWKGTSQEKNFQRPVKEKNNYEKKIGKVWGGRTYHP